MKNRPAWLRRYRLAPRGLVTTAFMSETTKTNTKITDQQVTHLPLAEVHPAPPGQNRPQRSGFDEKSMAELTESVRSQGIVQPLVVRKRKEGGHEIVCGERRYTAAKTLKLATVPCIIRTDLDDNAARKVRLIENLQREDLHPVEEAQGYADLIALKGADGKPLNTVESIAAEIGKSSPFVYGRLRLLKMPELALEASFSSKLAASNALLVARIPNPKLAYRATLEILDPGGVGEGKEREKRALDDEIDPMSTRRAQKHVQDHYMIRLKGAPFNQEDAQLVPIETLEGERICGGKCSDCPWRTGNMKGLFADVSSKDVCTNTDCFKRKKEAAFKKASQQAKAQGHTLLRDGKASQLFRDGQLVSTHEYVDVRGVFPGEKKKTWEQVLGAKLPDNLVQARDDNQAMHFLIPIAAAREAAKAVGRTLPKPFGANGHSAPMPDPEELQRQEEQRRKQAERTNALAVELAKLVLDKAENEPNLPWWRWMVHKLVEGQESSWATRFGCKNATDLVALIDKATEGKCRAMLVGIVALARMVDYDGQLSADLLEACDFYKIDHKKLVAEKQGLWRVEDKAASELAKLKGKEKAANDAKDAAKPARK